MRNYSLYSFEGSTMTIHHPHFEGPYTAYGTGLGTFEIAYSGDVVDHQVSADLSTVISKHATRNGTLTLNILQSTNFNDYIKRWANYVINSDPSEFALTEITIENSTTGDKYYLHGCTPQKIANQNFQPEAQERQWVIMVAEIVNN